MKKTTLANAIELWDWQHEGVPFMKDITIHKEINKDTLLDYLLYEYGELRCDETNSDTFHDRVVNFFEIHKWNIDKLAESLLFDYKPLDNTNWNQVTDYDRGQDFDSNIDRDVDVNRTEGIDTVKDWTENGSSDETDRHYVSGFNDADRDTAKTRDVITKNYNQKGKDTIGTDDTEKIGTEEDILKKETTAENIDVTITRKGHDGNISYQSLIEEERKQAQFNIYKWIGKHFSNELLICIW